MRSKGKVGCLGCMEAADISRRGCLFETAQSAWFPFFFVAATMCSVGANSGWAQSRRPAGSDRRPILARLLRPESEDGRTSESQPPSGDLSRHAPVSELSRGDVVITKEAVPLKIGTETVGLAPARVGLTVLDARGDWLGVVDVRGGREIRGWVKSYQVSSPRIGIRIQETQLTSVTDDGIDWSSATMTPDGDRIAYVTRMDEGSCVVIDGESGEIFDQIEPGQPVLSRGGRRIAYAAKRDQHWYVVVDEVVNGPYDSVHLGHPVVSADGSNVLAFVRKGEEQFLVVNGIEGTPYKEILDGSPILSADGKHYAYAAQSDGQWIVCLDGKQVTSFDEIAIENMAFRGDGSQLACIGKRNGLAVVQLDDEELASHEDARLPLFLPGEGGLCYQARDQGQWCIFVGAEKSESFEDVGDFVVDMENNGVAFWARDGNGWRVVRGEEKGPGYDGFGRGSLTLSPVGQRLAYVAIRDQEAFVVIDGKEGPHYEAVLAGTPVFNPTGKNVAYAAFKEGMWRLYVDHIEQRAFDSIAEFSVRFTPDGTLPFSLVGSGERVALAVGDAVSQFDYLFPRGSLVLPVSENRLMMVAIRNEQFLRVEAEIETKQ